MRNLLLLVAIVMLPAAAVAANAPGRPKSNVPHGKHQPLRGAASAVNSCAAFGAGFIKLEGSDTCMKIGGSIGVGVGVSSPGWR